MKKQLIAIILLVCTILLCACGGSGDAKTTTTTKKDDAGNNTPAKLLVSDYYAALATDNGASLTIDGSNATLVLITDTDTVTYTGAYTVSADKLTIGDKTFDFTSQEKFISVKDGENEFKMAPTTATSEAYTGIKMLSTAWSGDGLSLSFKGMQCTFKLGDIDVTAECIATSSFLSMEIPAENFALSGTVEASSCSEPDQLPPEAAIDGDESTRWSSWYDKNNVDPTEDDVTFVIDLGEEKNITTVRLMWEVAAGKDYTVDISKDGVVWTTIADVKDNDVTGEFLEYTCDKTAARYVRMHGSARTTEYGFSIWEMEAYENFVDSVDTFYSIVDGKLKITYGGQEYTLSPAA